MGTFFYDEDDVMDFRFSHIVLFIVLFLKEVVVYLSCVKRAESKLAKENRLAAHGSLNDSFTRAK